MTSGKKLQSEKIGIKIIIYANNKNIWFDNRMKLNTAFNDLIIIVFLINISLNKYLDFPQKRKVC